MPFIQRFDMQLKKWVDDEPTDKPAPVTDITVRHLDKATDYAIRNEYMGATAWALIALVETLRGNRNV